MFVYRHLQKSITKPLTVILLKMYVDKHKKRLQNTYLKNKGVSPQFVLYFS